MLDFVGRCDEEICAKAFIIARGDEVVEANKAQLEALGLCILETGEHDCNDVGPVGFEGCGRKSFDDGFEEIDTIALINLGGEELLE